MNIKLLVSCAVAISATSLAAFIYTSTKSVDPVVATVSTNTELTEQVQTSSRLAEESLTISEIDSPTATSSVVNGTTVSVTESLSNTQSVSEIAAVESTDQVTTESSFDALVAQEPTGFGTPIGNIGDTVQVISISNDILTGTATGGTSVSTSR